MTRPSFLRSLTALLVVLSAAAFVVGVIFERSQSGETTTSSEIAAAPTSTPRAESNGEVNGEAASVTSPTTHSEVNGEASLAATPTPPAEGGSGESAATLATEAAASGGPATPTSGTGESAATLATEAAASGGATHVETAGGHHAEAKLFGVNPESTALVVLVALVSLTLALTLTLWRSAMAALLAGAIIFGVVFAAFDVREALHQHDESHTGLMVLALTIAALHASVALAAALALWSRAAPPEPTAERGKQ